MLFSKTKFSLPSLVCLSLLRWWALIRRRGWVCIDRIVIGIVTGITAIGWTCHHRLSFSLDIIKHVQCSWIDTILSFAIIAVVGIASIACILLPSHMCSFNFKLTATSLLLFPSNFSFVILTKFCAARNNVIFVTQPCFFKFRIIDLVLKGNVIIVFIAVGKIQLYSIS